MLYRLLSSEMLYSFNVGFFPHWCYDACEVGKLEFESPHLLFLCAKLVLYLTCRTFIPYHCNNWLFL